MHKINEASFSQFGSIYFHPIASERYDLNCKQITINSSATYILHKFPCEVFIEPNRGIGSILIGRTPDTLNIFPVHHCLKIKPNVYFNLVANSSTFSFNLVLPPDVSSDTTTLFEPYMPKIMRMPFSIPQIYDCSYITHETSCTFFKPSHPHYELIYVCSGYMRITNSKNDGFTLNTHDLILLSPNENYSRQFSLNTSCSYLIVVFDIELSSNYQMLNKILHCPVELQSILWKLIQQSNSDSNHNEMLVICHLQEIIANIIKLDDDMRMHQQHVKNAQSFQNNQLKKILSYMSEKVTEPLSIEDICHEFFMSRSSLQTLFKINLGCSPKNYLMNMKLEKSKELIRKNEQTISEIAYSLGFSSIHYFSRLFKKYYQISPSDYAHGIEPASHELHFDDETDES